MRTYLPQTIFKRLNPYLLSIVLIISIVLGGFVGSLFPSLVPLLKPVGQFFLNLMLTTIVPLILFSVTASIIKLKHNQSISSQLGMMMGIFLILGSLAAIWMLNIVYWFPTHTKLTLPTSLNQPLNNISIFQDWPNFISVTHFGDLFSTEHILPLIIFSLMLGASCRKIDKKNNNDSIRFFFTQGEQICLELFNIIMRLAPIGFFCYFAAITHELGENLLGQYFSIVILYIVSISIYMLVVYSCIVYFLGGSYLLKNFWKQIWLPATTAIATCSSAACIPANLQALKKLHVEDSVAETLIPLGTLLHKQGSIMAGVLKIAFLYSLFHLNFYTFSAYLSAFGISLLVGMVMGAIPSGGMLGELLILHIYGFPPNALYLIATISLIIDSPATLINVCGNTIAGLINNKFNNVSS